MGKSQLNPFINIFLISLGVVFLVLYILIIAFFNLDLTQKIIIFINFLIILLIFCFLMVFLRKKVKSNFQIREVEVPIIKEVIKEVIKKVKVPIINQVEAPKERNYKYYGSKEASTYHLKKCRFSGMIKKPHLILKNSRSYFTKNKFRPCKNCNPHKN